MNKASYFFSWRGFLSLSNLPPQIKLLLRQITFSCPKFCPFLCFFTLCKLSSGKIKNGAEQSLSASTKRITIKSGSTPPNCQSATENRNVNQLKLCQCALSCSAFRSLWAHLMWDRIDPCTWAVRFTFSAAVSFSHFRFALLLWPKLAGPHNSSEKFPNVTFQAKLVSVCTSFWQALILRYFHSEKNAVHLWNYFWINSSWEAVEDRAFLQSLRHPLLGRSSSSSLPDVSVLQLQLCPSPSQRQSPWYHWYVR